MPARDGPQLARDMYQALRVWRSQRVEQLLSDDFTFYSPADVRIDRARYFEGCRPNSELIEDFAFTRLIDAGGEVVVTYESTQTDGNRFRNTDALTLEGDKICKAEVYFGWNLG